MKNTVFKTTVFLLSAVYAISVSAAPAFSLYDLRCEQEDNPVGIDIQQPCFSWKTYSVERGFIQSAYQILVSDTPEATEQDKGNIWNSGKVNSAQSVLIPFAGKSLKSFAVYYWKVRTWDKKNRPSEWSTVQTFTMGLTNANDWGRAVWIAMEKDRKEEYTVPARLDFDNIRKTMGERSIGFYKLPQLRKTFTVPKPVKRAVACVAGLGHFDLFLNGEKVGDHFLDAGWTKYDNQAQYVAFDLTGRLQAGENVLGVMLGNGFYNIPFDRYLKLIISHGAPKMKLHLHIEYADGSTGEIVSDASWKATESPIIFSSIYGGEDYDARLYREGWTTPGFNDTSWQQAITTGYTGTLSVQRATPLTVHSSIPAILVYKNAQGKWIYDLGQNFSGIIRIAVKSNESRTILFRPAELLNNNGTANQSASGGPFYFSYTAKGAGQIERWQPRFTYYGFRYVEVEGAVPAGKDNPEHLPEIESLTGLHTCNSADEAGSFVCSRPMFNQIHSLIDWAIRSNMASVLTDCPHREKLGWLEQAHLMQYSLQYRYNLARLYPKIMEDMRASQLPDGCVPTIAPEYVRFANGFEDTPEWGSSFIICPWYIYQWYGDRRLLDEYYPSMQRYLDYLGTRADNHIVAYGLGDWFDIGPNNPGYAQLTANGVTATAIYHYNTTIMQHIASILGKTDDAARYGELAGKIRKAFNEKFYDSATGKIERNSQTANAIALYAGLVPAERRTDILQNLIDDIRGRGNALTAGDVGYRYVLRALEDGGRSDVIFDMNSRYDVPGYGWQLAHGATALTESWQAYGFVSNNHFMLGHLMEWLYGGLGGIRQQENSIAFREIVIDPQIVGDVHSATTSYESPYGTIRCSWALTDKDYRIEVSIPANSTAEIRLPTTDVRQVTTYGLPLSTSKDVTVIGVDAGKLRIKIGSGDYQFKCSMKFLNYTQPDKNVVQNPFVTAKLEERIRQTEVDRKEAER
ncbi:MAG: family 78 glycoside hydrolase catalytic domain [Tannerella sp.]|nr:family 78 glycoside hydrolase catalytic domain [Tannerella sp.]